MIHAQVIDDRIAVGMPPTYNEVAKRIPGSAYKGGTWTFPLSWSACLQLRDEFGDLLVVGQSLVNWAQGYLARRESVLAAQRGEFVLPGLDERLRPKQALGATWLAWAGRCILGDEMRAGKTPQMIQALKAVGPSAFPALLIAPSTNRWVWADEFVTWDDNVCTIVLHGTAGQKRKQLAEAHTAVDAGLPVCVITNWEAIRTLSRLEAYGSVELSEKEKTEGPLNEMGFKTVIADEAHRALDPHAKQTRALWYLMHQAERRYCMTATGIANNGADLYSLWHAVAPEECPKGRSKWVERYCVAGQGRFGWEIGGFRPEKSEEMFAALDPRFLRRTMREVREGMPDRLPVEVRRQVLEGSQAKTYADLKRKMVAELPTEDGGKGILVVTDPLTLSGRLAYSTAATPILNDEGGVVALGMPSVKVDVLKEVLDQNPGEPLVVFAVSRKLIVLCEEQLTKAKIEWVSVHGGIDPMLRAANISRFQAGHCQVILLTEAAGAVGITLNRANRTLFLQRSWSSVDNVQAEARTDGLEGGAPIETIIHVVVGSLEEGMYDDPDMSPEQRAMASNARKSGYLQELVRDALRGG